MHEDVCKGMTRPVTDASLPSQGVALKEQLWNGADSLRRGPP